MPKVSEQHRIDRRDEIIDAALRAFQRKGFHATSMAEIIAESGLSAGAIYGYFTGKSEIVLAVATKVVGARIVDLENLARLDPMPDPGVMVRTVLDGLLTALDRPSMLLQVWGEAATDAVLLSLCADLFARLRDALVGYIARWHELQHGLSKSAASALGSAQAPLFVSAIQGFIVQDSLFLDFDREHYLARTLTFLPK